MKLRARRRLIGAAALLLAAVIVVPMVLDPTPRPVPDTVPIDIPSEKTAFSPRLPLPPVPDPGAVQVPQAPEPLAEGKPAAGEAKAEEEKADKGGGDARAAAAAKTSPPKAASAAAPAPDKTRARSDADAEKLAEAQRARDILEGRLPKTAAAQSASEGKYLVQAAAPRSQKAANDLAARLKKAGLPSFIERVQASDGTRWRVRAGPYATREEAERARTKLRELGLGADLISP